MPLFAGVQVIEMSSIFKITKDLILKYSYVIDFHQKRVDMANEEFKSHKIENYVTARQKDVCEEGFGNELENKVDAVFLDLPHPWDAVPHAKKVLRRSTGGRLCSFSPCIEQVQKAIEKMREEGFTEISTKKKSNGSPTGGSAVTVAGSTRAG